MTPLKLTRGAGAALLMLALLLLMGVAGGADTQPLTLLHVLLLMAAIELGGVGAGLLAVADLIAPELTQPHLPSKGRAE